MRAALLVLLTAALLHSQVTRIPGGSGGGGGGGGGVQEVGAGGGITVTNPTGPTATVAVDTAVVPTKGAEHTIAERWLFSKGLAITPGSDPASPEAGRVTINTSHLLRVWTGTVWRTALYDPGSNGLLRRTTEGLTGAVAVCQSGQYLTGDGVDPSCAQVNASQVTNAFDKSTSNTILDGTQDFTSAAATRPFRRLAFASFPSTCQAGTDMLVRSNPATAGQVLYICNSSGNGWDLVGDGGGGSGMGDSFDTISSLLDPSKVIYMRDTFTGGTNTSAQLGEMGWFFSTCGTVTLPESPQFDAAGLFTIPTNTTANSVCRLALGPNSTSNRDFRGLNAGTWRNIWRIRLNSISDVRFFIGKIQSHTVLDDQGYYFKFDPAVSSNWIAVSRDGSGVTSTVSEIPATTNFVRLMMYNDGTATMYYINGTLVATHTTNRPAGNLHAVIQISPTTTTAKSVDVDDYFMLMKID